MMLKNNLFSILKETSKLPDYLQTVTSEALRQEWLKGNDLTRKVLNGEITLVEIVTPLVSENEKVSFWGYKKGIGNSRDFEFMAASTVGELQGLISFEDGFRILREKTSLREKVFPTLKIIWLIVLFSLLVAPWLKEVYPNLKEDFIFSPTALIIGGVIFSLIALDVHRSWLNSRKKTAQKLLEAARLLDNFIQGK